MKSLHAETVIVSACLKLMLKLLLLLIVLIQH